MSKQIKELTGANYYVGTEYEIKLMAKKINELVNQVSELTETVNVLKQKLEVQMTNEMTAKEAVKQIKENCYFASISENTKKAFDKAIQALEAQPTDAKKSIIKSALKGLVKMQIEEGSVGFAVDNDHDHDCCWDDVLAWIEAQPCEDCISREAVLDIINFEDKWLFDANGHNANTHIAFIGLDSRVKALPSVTPQASEEDIHREREQAYMLGYEDASKKFRTEPCEDCISRQAVIKHICESKECYKEECKGRILKRCPDLQWVFDLPSVTPKYTDEEIDRAQAIEQAYVDKMVELAVEESRQKVKPSDCANRSVVKLDMLKYGFSSPNMTVTEFVDSLPPVTPQRQKGKWIMFDDEANAYCCNQCNEVFYLEYGNPKNNGYRYCPNCGSYNGGGEDERDSN